MLADHRGKVGLEGLDRHRFAVTEPPPRSGIVGAMEQDDEVGSVRRAAARQPPTRQPQGYRVAANPAIDRPRIKGFGQPVAPGADRRGAPPGTPSATAAHIAVAPAQDRRARWRCRQPPAKRRQRLALHRPRAAGPPGGQFARGGEARAAGQQAQRDRDGELAHGRVMAT